MICADQKSSASALINSRMISIPREFLIMHIGNRKDLRLFLFLKLLYPQGKYKTSELPIDLISHELEVDRRTVVRRLESLANINWISTNIKTGYSLVHSPRQIMWGYKKRRYSKQKLMIHNIKAIDATMGFVIFKKCSLAYKWKLNNQGGFAYLKANAFTSHLDYLPKGYSPIALRGASKIFGVSLNMVNRLKNAAIKESYIKVLKPIKIIRVGGDAKLSSEHPFKFLMNGIVYQNGVDLISFERIH